MIDRLLIVSHLLAARRNFTRWRSREDLEAWQDRQVTDHLAKILSKTRYYRELYGCDSTGYSPRLNRVQSATQQGTIDWRNLPISKKADLMAAFDDWNTAGITLAEASQVAETAERTRDFSPTIRGFAVGMSSGTTGSRGLFLVSPQERRRWAGTLLARALRDSVGQRHRAALFLRADSPLYQTVGSRRLSFSFFDLFAPFSEHWPRLLALRPTLLAAPPAALVRLAQNPGAGDLLAPPGILLSVADVLEDGDRAIIEAGFQTKVGQLYQATEGFLAATCRAGTLHWNEDAIVIQKEWIDREKTRYHPIITDFRRTTQPILRFRLDDVIVEGDQKSCSCGTVFGTLAKIEGRQDDVFYLPSLRTAEPVMLFPDFVRRAMILSLPTGVEYTVTQAALDSWMIELAEPVFAPAVTTEIQRLCGDLHLRPPSLIFAPWTTPDPRNKRRRIRRAMPPP